MSSLYPHQEKRLKRHAHQINRISRIMNQHIETDYGSEAVNWNNRYRRIKEIRDEVRRRACVTLLIVNDQIGGQS